MILSFMMPSGEMITPEIKRLIATGFAGRNTADVEHHIEEMVRQGVPRPPRYPMFWPVLPHLLTQGEDTVVYGQETTPEVEYVLFAWRNNTYVTLGNDQCDIEVEARLSSEKSKNLCQKIVARQAWPLADVLPHWDELVLTLACNGVVLQQDALSALIRPQNLLDKVSAVDGTDDDGRMIFSGTIATKGRLPPAPYDAVVRLSDPVLGREIEHAFRVDALSALEKAAPVSAD